MKTEENRGLTRDSHLKNEKRENYVFGAVLVVPILLSIIWLSPDETQPNSCRAILPHPVSLARSQNDV